MEILISALIGIALMELYAWLEPFAKWLVKRVAKKLPDAYQAEFTEQFFADLDALPNSIAKVFFAIRDCTMSSKSIQEAANRRAFADVVDKFDSIFEKFKLAKLRQRLIDPRLLHDDEAQALIDNFSQAFDELAPLMAENIPLPDYPQRPVDFSDRLQAVQDAAAAAADLLQQKNGAVDSRH